MRSRKMDPDLTRKNDAPYWGAVLMMALRDGKRDRVKKAKRELRRLGYPLTVGTELAKGVTDER